MNETLIRQQAREWLLKQNVPAEQIELILAGASALLDVIANVIGKRAENTGTQAANVINTPEDAEQAARERK